MRIFVDDWDGTEYTEEMLRTCFNELKTAGETDCPTFADYMRETTGIHGQLSIIERG